MYFKTQRETVISAAAVNGYSWSIRLKEATAYDNANDALFGPCRIHPSVEQPPRLHTMWI